MTVQDLRQMGIEELGEMPWGTHLCAFYDSEDDLLDLLLPYFGAGLRKHEFCIYVAWDRQDRDDVEEEMHGHGLDRYLERGQMRIIPAEEWYLRGGFFDARRVLDSWVENCHEARASGYDGIRVMGNMAWLDRVDWQSLADYEYQANRLFNGHPMIAVCSYPLERCDERRATDLVAAHQFELVRTSEEWTAVGPSQPQGAVDNVMRLRDELHNLDGLLNEGRLEKLIASMLSDLEDSFGGRWVRSLACWDASRDLSDKIRTWAAEQLEGFVGEAEEIHCVARKLAMMHRKMSGARCVRARADSTGLVIEVEGCPGFDGCETRTSRAHFLRCAPAMAVAAMLQTAAETPVWIDIREEGNACRIGLHPGWVLECLRELEPFKLDGLVVLRGGRVLFSHIPTDSEAEVLDEAVLLDEEKPVEGDGVRVEELERRNKKVVMARLGENLISLCVGGDYPTEGLRLHLARAVSRMASL